MGFAPPVGPLLHILLELHPPWKVVFNKNIAKNANNVCIECTGGLRVSVNKPLFWHCGVKNVANSQLWYEDTQSFQNLHYRKLALERLDFPFWKFKILYFLIPKFLHYFERGIFLNRSEFWPLCTVIWTNSMILFNFIVWTSSTIWYPTQYTDHHLIWEQQSCSYKH